MMIESLQNAEMLARRAARIGAIVLVLPVIIVISWLFDRTPPFELLNYTAIPARAGQVLHVDGPVRRDVDRMCSVEFSRAIYSADGTRIFDGKKSTMNSKALSLMDKQMAGRFKVDYDIPPTAKPGPITVVTNLDYECNPSHQIWPIEVVVVIKSEVLP